LSCEDVEQKAGRVVRGVGVGQAKGSRQSGNVRGKTLFSQNGNNCAAKALEGSGGGKYQRGVGGNANPQKKKNPQRKGETACRDEKKQGELREEENKKSGIRQNDTRSRENRGGGERRL